LLWASLNAGTAGEAVRVKRCIGIPIGHSSRPGVYQSRRQDDWHVGQDIARPSLTLS